MRTNIAALALKSMPARDLLSANEALLEFICPCLVLSYISHRQGKFIYIALFNTRQFKVLYKNERH